MQPGCSTRGIRGVGPALCTQQAIQGSAPRSHEANIGGKGGACARGWWRTAANPNQYGRWMQCPPQKSRAQRG